MAQKETFPVVFDNHFHLRPEGSFLEPVIRFNNAGGTAINLTNLPNYDLGPADYYGKLYDSTIRIAERIRKETGTFVMVTCGPYPLDYFYFQEAKMNPVEEMSAGIDLAAKLYSTGKIQAIGEIGTPHFKVDEEDYKKIHEVLMRAFEICGDLKIPVVLHSEDLTQAAHDSLCDSIRKFGLDCKNVVKHHATANLLGLENGLTLSLPASRPNVRQGISTKSRFMLETDYVNDQLSPDKFMPPDAVPRRAAFIKQEFEDWEKILEDIFVATPKMAYGLIPSATLNK